MVQRTPPTGRPAKPAGTAAPGSTRDASREDGRDVRVDAALVAAVRHLETAVAEQERAVTRILGLVELLLDKAEDRVDRARLEGILESCGFQDLTGQRITKVARFLRYLATELQVDVPAPRRDQASDPTETDPQASGPQTSGLSQEDVDRLLRGDSK